MQPVLIIRFSSFGDIVLSLAAMQAIRKHHAGAHLVCLTASANAPLVEQSGIFDTVISDPRPRPLRRGGMRATLSLVQQLKRYGFSHIYDLHDSPRARSYLRLIATTSRAAKRAKIIRLPRLQDDDTQLHELDRIRETLAAAGIDAHRAPDLSGFTAALPPEIEAALGDRDFALLFAGAGGRKAGDRRWPARPTKCWPARHFGELAQRLHARGVLTVLGGTQADAEIAAVIRSLCPSACDLLGKTDAASLVALARRARLVVANDTGPAHLAAFARAPVISLFGDSPPARRWAPLNATVLEHAPLAELEADTVWQAVERVLGDARA